jgi:hypothetical protein
MAQVLSKEYECLSCHEPIKIAKLDNVPPGQKRKWERFEIDGVTPHQSVKKKEDSEDISGENTASVDNVPSQIAELAKEVSSLKETINILISQIQVLRSEVKNKK